MRTKFFCTNFLNTPRGPGHPARIPGTSQIPLSETQGRQTFEGGHEVFGHHPFEWKTPTPPGGLRTQKVNLCALFSCRKSRAPGNIRSAKQGPNIATLLWGSPKASHIKASHPHFPRFRVRIFRVFRVFALRNLLRPLFFWGKRDFPHFPRFLRIGFESLISKIRPTGFRMTGLR